MLLIDSDPGAKITASSLDSLVGSCCVGQYIIPYLVERILTDLRAPSFSIVNSGSSERLNRAKLYDPAYMLLRDRMEVDKAYKTKGFTCVEPDEDWREDLKGEELFFRKGHRDRASRFFSWYICIQQWLPMWLTSYYNGSLQ